MLIKIKIDKVWIINNKIKKKINIKEIFEINLKNFFILLESIEYDVYCLIKN